MAESVTPEQIDEVFSAAFGFPAREADKQVVASLGGTTDVLAEYMWDHWMGEPDDTSMEDVQTEIEYVLGFRETNGQGERPHLDHGFQTDATPEQANSEKLDSAVEHRSHRPTDAELEEAGYTREEAEEIRDQLGKSWSEIVEPRGPGWLR